MLNYAIFGAKGKMGQKLIIASQKFKNEASLIKKFTKKQEEDYEKISLQSIKELNFIIDFSTPEASIELAKICQNTNILIVCGTTGFTEKQMKEMQNLSSNVKILYSANFSIGVNKFFNILEYVTNMLTKYEVEILEKHHSKKKDAPSGTAIELGKIIAKTKNCNFNEVASFERNHLRKPEEIGFASIRQGNIFGFHEVCFANEDEKIWIGHEAFNKDIFANGAIEIAIKACKNLINKKFGMFSCNDFI